MSDDLRRLVNERVSADTLRCRAVEEGMVSLHENARRLVVKRVTSGEEIHISR